MAVPVIYLALGAGKAIYKIANTPAGKEMLKKFMSKGNPYGIRQISKDKLPTKIKDKKVTPKNLTEEVLKQKDPTIFQKIGGAIRSLYDKNAKITKQTPGVNKPKEGANITNKRIKADTVGKLAVGGAGAAAAIGGGAVVYNKLKPKPKPKRKPSAEPLDRKNINTARPRPKPKPRVKKKDYSPPGRGIKRITVQKGDRLETIAKRENTTVDRIMKLNPNIKNRNKINTGQKIIVRGN